MLHVAEPLADFHTSHSYIFAKNKKRNTNVVVLMLLEK